MTIAHDLPIAPHLRVTLEEAIREADLMGLEGHDRGTYINIATGGVGDVLPITEESTHVSDREPRRT